MAIIIDKGIEPSSALEPVYYFGFANKIIKFHSDTLTALYATVRGRKIYPTALGNQFQYNLKDIFVDSIKTTTNDMNDNELITTGLRYSNFFGGSGINQLILKIYDDAGTSETYTYEKLWLLAKAVQFKEPDFVKMDIVDYFSTIGAKLTLFKGYPFDFTIGGGKQVELRNENDILLGNFNNHFYRLYLSKGNADLNLNGGDIYLKDNDTGKTIEIIKVKHINNCEGTYLKWLSPQGTFKYWLFSEKKTVTKQSKNKGYWINEFADDSTNANKYNSLGKKEQKKVTRLHAINLEAYERAYLSDIIDSPRVYIYTKKKFLGGTTEDFKQISVIDNSFVVENLNKNIWKISISIEELENPIY